MYQATINGREYQAPTLQSLHDVIKAAEVIQGELILVRVLYKDDPKSEKSVIAIVKEV